MSDSHAKLPKLFWVQLALAAIIGIIFLATPSKHNEESGAEEGKVAAVAKNLEPVGSVSTKEAKKSGSAKARSGEEVYKATCMACHANGVANAPKPSDKAAWEPRVATGLDALMHSALNGKGAMPARGGNPATTDEEIKAVILYMTSKAGFDLSSAKKAPTKEMEKETKKVTEKVLDTKKDDMPVAAAVVPTAPSAPATPTPPKVMEVAPVKPVAPEASSEPKTEVVSAPTMNNEKGAKVYQSLCFSCHQTGVAGSPKLGDKEAWAPRIATGQEALYSAAIKGKGIMPPKGGNMSLTGDDVKAAVNYMVSKSQ